LLMLRIVQAAAPPAMQSAISVAPHALAKLMADDEAPIADANADFQCANRVRLAHSNGEDGQRPPGESRHDLDVLDGDNSRLSRYKVMHVCRSFFVRI
jgi:hypothetical protein